MTVLVTALGGIGWVGLGVLAYRFRKLQRAHEALRREHDRTLYLMCQDRC